MSAPAPDHRPGHDPLGSNIPIAIRLDPDGRVSFHDITPAFLPIALALDPGNPDLLARAHIAARFDACLGTPAIPTGNAP